MHAAVKAGVLVLVLVIVGTGVVYTTYTHTAAISTTALVEVSKEADHENDCYSFSTKSP